MKKKYVVIFSVLLIVSVLIYICIPKEKEEIKDTETKVNTNGFLTLMLEQEDGSYQKSSTSTWPKTGYIFNGVLSNCENGGKLIWNDELKTITLKTNKSDKCYVYFDKYINPVVNNVTVIDTSTSSISVSVNASGGTNSVATYYYSINNGEFTSSTSNTYTFSGLNKETTYTIKVYVKDTNGIDSSVFTINAETENIVLLADYIKGLYTSQGSNGIYYHTSSLANSAEDNSYRYAGANPNNYVCFGSDAATCTSDNLYRIIGVFDDEVKLIKSTSIGNYEWAIDWKVGNTWSKSDIRTTLNTTYYNTLSSAWQNKIAIHTWKVGGMLSNAANTAKQYYDVEVGSSSSSTTDSVKIGLMYVSDYGYAVSNNYWTTALYNYNDITLRSNNWLYSDSSELTITINSNSSGFVPSVFFVHYSGNVYYFDMDIVYAIRPCFYLTSSTTYVSGSGTSNDPIRIN